MSNVYVALLHYPIINKQKEVVATAITSFDIHDIARTCRTYGVVRYFLVNPLKSQHYLSQRVIDYWHEGVVKKWNPARQKALEIVEVTVDLEETIDIIAEKEGKKPILVSTSARKYGDPMGYPELAEKMKEDDTPYLIIFGTGYGIADECMEQTDITLEPIVGPGDEYNHLAVRAASAIILDRLLAPK